MKSSLLTGILLRALLATAIYVALLVPVGALAGDGADGSATAETAATEVATEAPTTAATEIATQIATEQATQVPTTAATEVPTEAATQAATQAATETATQTGTPAEAATGTATADSTSTASPSASPEATATALPAPDKNGKGQRGDFGLGDADRSDDSKKKAKRQQTFTEELTACMIKRDEDKANDNVKVKGSGKGGDCADEIKKVQKAQQEQMAGDAIGGVIAPPSFQPDGTPTLSNPLLSISTVGAAPIGVPNFFIDKFRIPPFLLPIYQAAGTEYGIQWQVLAAINEIETDYGRNLNVSSAGALGWMQFMPATWKQWGVDANQDGVKDPFNPVDAIFAAARYLKAAGGQQDIRRGIFAYNHANWYVDSVMLRARTIGGLPADFVGSLTGLTQARFPVQADARYAGQVNVQKEQTVKPGQNAALPVESDAARTSIDIFAKKHSPVIAVNDGKVVALGNNAEDGNFIKIQDSYGNTYTYSHLGNVAATYPAPIQHDVSDSEVKRELHLPGGDPKPSAPASETTKNAKGAAAKGTKAGRAAEPAAPATERVAAKVAPKASPTPVLTAVKTRLFANPHRDKAALAGGDIQTAPDAYQPTAGTGDAILHVDPANYTAKPLRRGVRVIGGTILGHIGVTDPGVAPHVTFAIRPAGAGAPLIDPKPILDGWKLLESTAIYRAQGRNALVGDDAREPSIGQILLMSKEALQRLVLDSTRISIYECGRRDIRLGLIDRRVLATLAFLASSGLKPTVSALECGHSYLTTSGNVSEHSSGNAVDIAAVNGIPIVGNQGPGTITETTIQRLLTLQGTMKPHQIISLMTFPGADNTLALADHYDHIHVGFHPLYGANTRAARQLNAVLKPNQWIHLIDRLSEVDNPVVPTTPSKYAVSDVAPDTSTTVGDASSGD
ncbi:MAG: hypothetical protein QOF76_1134 [Solirubrobacteraceae bacterium]|nr:hypothetical protein [Solirubrobacteraceae bacterium]